MCFKGVSRALHGCFKKVSSVFKECIQDDSRKFQRRFKKVFQECFREESILRRNHQGKERQENGHHI